MTPWKYPGSYMGPDRTGYGAMAGRSRDSDLLEECNFDSIVKLLKEIELEGCSPESGEVEANWFIQRDYHWAVGWVETLFVRLDAPQNILDLCKKIENDLEGYPLLDEEEYSRREYESVRERWADVPLDERLTLVHNLNERCYSKISIFAIRRDDTPFEDAFLYDMLRPE